MAEAREQINPRVNVSTKALLATYCQEKKATQGDAVEAAILAFIQPPLPGEEGLSGLDFSLMRLWAAVDRYRADRQPSRDCSATVLGVCTLPAGTAPDRARPG